jgi:hypothetical protein
MIPRTIHQIWIGDVFTPPLALMQTWKDCATAMNVEYILWTEEEIRKRGVVFECQRAIDVIPEINGKADIIRWEILLRYGGIFIDADSICVEPLIDDFFTPRKMVFEDRNRDRDGDGTVTGFSAFENETARPNLVATGTMGFTKNHPLVADIVEWLKWCDISQLTMAMAWLTVGPGCITRFLETGKYKDTVVVFPSHYFIPIHYTVNTPHYTGHQKVYAHQLWGTGEQEYRKTGGNMLPILPPELLPDGSMSVSVLVNSYNTPRRWIHECLQSIQNQRGRFMIELVWIDDGSTTPFADDLTEEIKWFKMTTRFVSGVVHHRMPENVGTRRAIDYGLALCTNELVIKMDADDIMFPARIDKQINYMSANPQVVCCGGQLIQFTEKECDGNVTEKVCGRVTNHPLTVTEEQCYGSPWFMNHPTLCYRKWAVEDVGGYGVGANLGEDRELEVKLWEHFGDGSVCNMGDILVLYRMHSGQLSWQV